MFGSWLSSTTATTPPPSSSPTTTITSDKTTSDTMKSNSDSGGDYVDNNSCNRNLFGLWRSIISIHTITVKANSINNNDNSYGKAGTIPSQKTVTGTIPSSTTECTPPSSSNNFIFNKDNNTDDSNSNSRLFRSWFSKSGGWKR